jgi:hypothetical protein
MKATLTLAAILMFGTSAAVAAVIVSPTPRPVIGPPPPAPPPSCIPQNPADYVPNTAANGRPVVPADVVPQSNVVASTRVYTAVPGRNPRVPGAGVIVDLPDLALPRCPSPPVKSKVNF